MYFDNKRTMVTKLQNVEVLLIEDNQDDADMVIRTLKKNNVGNRLLHLSDGAEALDFLFASGKFSNRSEQMRPKVILLDLSLPRISGIDILRKIKNDERTKAIPVVIMTTSSEAKDILDSYQIGVNGYVVKPMTFADFARTVSDLGFYWMFTSKLPT
jgi:two-component system response regulator